MIPAGVATAATDHYRMQAKLTARALCRREISRSEAVARLLAIAERWCRQ